MAETQTNTDRPTTDPPILNARQLVELLLGDHEGGQVGGVGGQEDQGEERQENDKETQEWTLSKTHTHR